MSITEIAIKRPLLITVIFTVLILFGIGSYFSLNYNLLPNIQVNTVTVSTIYPGASAAEVETSVTRKLEDILASIEGLDEISATSQQGVSQVTVTLKSNINVDDAERDIQRSINQSQNQLPKTVESPVVKKISLEETPVIQAGVTATLDDRELYDLVDLQIKTKLQNVQGVGQVNVIGGDERQIQVNVNQDKLNAYRLSIVQVTRAIANANLSFPAGSIESGTKRLAILYDANVTSVSELEKIIISKSGDNSTIYLKDIATISDATVDPTAINHINGLPSIGLQIIKQSDANAVDVSARVKETFTELQGIYKSNALTFSVSADQSTYTLASAHSVMEDLVIAILIVGIVMLAFLHSVRSSMFVLIALPASMIPTFIAMYALGFSLNLMTLMALSLVVGILVDDSIVVLENIYRHMEMGSDKRTAALEGRSEIGFTALAITLVDIIVFLPLAVSGGIIGSILKEFSLVVVFSTLMSLFVSFTITPLLASRFGKLEHLTKKNLWGRINLGFEKQIDDLKEGYATLLAWVLGKKRWFLSGVLILLFSSFLLLVKGFIGAAFIPVMDQGQVVIKMEMEAGTTVQESNLASQQAEERIRKSSEVVNVFTSVGFVTGSVVGTSSNSNEAEFNITLKDKSERSISAEEFGSNLQKELSASIPGIKFTAIPTSISGQGRAPVQISIQGTDLKAIRATAEKFKKIIAAIPGTESVALSVKALKPEIKLALDRDKMLMLGVDASQVGLALQNAFGGDVEIPRNEITNFRLKLTTMIV